MVKDKNTFYVTTPIYYPNDIPHIGHAYTTIAADILARWNKLLGKKVFFSTGIDEHGQKIEEAALKAGKKPLDFTNSLSKRFQEVWKLLEIDYSDFVRTTDEDHKDYVKEIIKKVNDAGDIYKDNYEGFYCTPCETFYTELQLEEGNKCPSCHRETHKVKEESYFFKLSKYENKLLDHYEKNPDFISPKTKRQEIINRVKEGLKDLSITRTSFDWGVPFPLDEKHVTYVWFDALTNYLSILKKNGCEEFWPCDVHLVGKDIMWFHTVIWPSMLFSAGIELPKKIFAHGWWTVEGEKMSKSKGNFILPKTVSDKYGVDAFRYFLFREMPFGNDGDFSDESMRTRYNTELGNELGNLVMRATVLVQKYFEGVIPNFENLEEIDIELKNKILSLQEKITKDLDNIEFNKALDDMWEVVRATNKYMNDCAPWKLDIEKDRKRIEVVMGVTCQSLEYISYFINPFMPGVSEKISSYLGFEIKTFDKLGWGDIAGKKVSKAESLFPRIEVKKKAHGVNNSSTQKTSFDESEEITPVGFEKLDLRVAKIINVEKHPDADKLFIEKVDLGNGEIRQIVSGLADYYQASELIDKKIVLLYNLEKAEIRGVASEGMLLAADDKDNKVGVILAPIDSKLGSKINLGKDFVPPKKISYKEFSKIKLVATVDGPAHKEELLVCDGKKLSVDKNIVGKIR